MAPFITSSLSIVSIQVVVFDLTPTSVESIAMGWYQTPIAPNPEFLNLTDYTV